MNTLKETSFYFINTSYKKNMPINLSDTKKKLNSTKTQAPHELWKRL